MSNFYLILAFILSLIEAGLVAYRYRRHPQPTTMLFYATGAFFLAFILMAGLAQVVWSVVRTATEGQPGGGGGSNAAFTLNTTTLLAGLGIIAVTAVVTTGATLAGVQVGRGLASPGGAPPTPVRLPETIDGLPLARLRQALSDRVDEQELANLAFDLGIDLDSFPDDGHVGRVRDLLVYLHQRGELPKLVAALRQQRPDLTL